MVCKFGIETPSEGFNEEDLDILEMTDENNQKYKNGIIRFYGDDNCFTKNTCCHARPPSSKL